VVKVFVKRDLSYLKFLCSLYFSIRAKGMCFIRFFVISMAIDYLCYWRSIAMSVYNGSFLYANDKF